MKRIKFLIDTLKTNLKCFFISSKNSKSNKIIILTTLLTVLFWKNPVLPNENQGLNKN